MREQMQTLTAARVNEAVRRHLSYRDLCLVMIAGDADRLRDELLADGVTTITYDSPKPQPILDEDQIIGARKLGVRQDAVRITAVEDVFGR